MEALLSEETFVVAVFAANELMFDRIVERFPAASAAEVCSAWKGLSEVEGGRPSHVTL